MQTEYHNRHKIGIYLMSCIAMGLGKSEDFFDLWYTKSTLSTMNAMHYVPRSRQLVKQDLLSAEQKKIVIKSHTDVGFITLLCTLGFPGL